MYEAYKFLIDRIGCSYSKDIQSLESIAQSIETNGNIDYEEKTSIRQFGIRNRSVSRDTLRLDKLSINQISNATILTNPFRKHLLVIPVRPYIVAFGTGDIGAKALAGIGNVILFLFIRATGSAKARFVGRCTLADELLYKYRHGFCHGGYFFIITLFV